MLAAVAVTASHTAVPGSILGKTERCQTSIVRILGSYLFVVVILV